MLNYEPVVIHKDYKTNNNVILTRLKFKNKAFPTRYNCINPFKKGLHLAYAEFNENKKLNRLFERFELNKEFFNFELVKIQNKTYLEGKSIDNYTFIFEENEIKNININKEYALSCIKYENKYFVIKYNEVIDAVVEVKNIFFEDYHSHYKSFSGSFLKNSFLPETSMPVFECNIPYLNKGDEFKIKGYWEKENNLRFIILSNYMERTFSDGHKSLIKFLTSSIPGLGKIKANRIVKEYGVNAIDIINNTPDKLIEIKGITSNMVEEIHKKLISAKSYSELFNIMQINGFYSKDISLVFDKFGIDALNKFKNNIYDLLEVNLNEKMIDKVAFENGYNFQDKRRIKYFIRSFLNNESISNGDLYTEKEKIFKNINKYIKSKNGFNYYELINQDKIEKILEELQFDKKIIIDNNDVYLNFYYFIESEIINKINQINKNILIKKENMIDKIDDIENMHENQIKGIINGINSNLSIITGGPGTGKTHTVNNLIKTIKKINPSSIIELAAPTGKAAKRMSEMTGMQASTIHRLIKLRPYSEYQEWNFNNEKLLCDYLIIDESSMIDAPLFYFLLNKIDLKTKIILVGDFDQLPPVGVGLIFRDLIYSKIFPVTKLTKVFRQGEGSEILTLARDILNENEISYPVKKCNSIDDLIQEIKIKLQNGEIKSVNDFIVLTPMNKGDFGTFKINTKLQNAFNHNPNCIKITPSKIFKVNDKVIQMTNDYDLEVFNGDAGVITEIDEFRDIIRVDFGDYEKTYTKLQAEGLALAYAITIHKSQGSEYKNVYMIFDKQSNFMISKNLIYTGVTRASENLEIFGEEYSLKAGSKRILSMNRNSKIIEKISK